MKKKNRLPALVIFSTFLCLGLMWLLYVIYGKHLLTSIYRGESIWVFRKFMEGRLEDYSKIYDRLMWCWTFLVILADLIYLAGLWIGIKPVLFVLAFDLILMEGAIATALSSPSILKYFPEPFFNHIREIYRSYDRVPIQTDPSCAHYDPDFSYLLNPGKCTFSGREFQTEIFVNSMGFRDDEKSLRAPAVIVLGDSFAFGWGVNQDETFAEIIEKKFHLNVLNTGIPSFGTVREMRVLDKVDTSQLKYLIIQYCINDYAENREFSVRGNNLITMTRQHYLELCQLRQNNHRYYLGKYCLQSLAVLLQNMLFGPNNDICPSPSKFQDYKNQTDLFLNALIHGSHLDLSKVKIIVLDLNSCGVYENKFIAELKARIAAGDYPLSIKNLIPIDLEETLKTKNFKENGYYYPLDRHLNRKGHAAVAEAIIKVMQDNGL